MRKLKAVLQCENQTFYIVSSIDTTNLKPFPKYSTDVLSEEEFVRTYNNKKEFNFAINNGKISAIPNTYSMGAIGKDRLSTFQLSSTDNTSLDVLSIVEYCRVHDLKAITSPTIRTKTVEGEEERFIEIPDIYTAKFANIRYSSKSPSINLAYRVEGSIVNKLTNERYVSSRILNYPIIDNKGKTKDILVSGTEEEYQDICVFLGRTLESYTTEGEDNQKIRIFTLPLTEYPVIDSSNIYTNSMYLDSDLVYHIVCQYYFAKIRHKTYLYFIKKLKELMPQEEFFDDNIFTQAYEFAYEDEPVSTVTFTVKGMSKIPSFRKMIDDIMGNFDYYDKIINKYLTKSSAEEKKLIINNLQGVLKRLVEGRKVNHFKIFNYYNAVNVLSNIKEVNKNTVLKLLQLKAKDYNYINSCKSFLNTLRTFIINNNVGLTSAFAVDKSTTSQQGNNLDLMASLKISTKGQNGDSYVTLSSPYDMPDVVIKKYIVNGGNVNDN